ncbi:MAG TPA: hypothetical protein VKV16_00635, partial [Solirubrobacteraceae bacterium]|nr:hypothetical protein [Solirubrobacteraceae bacterium]
MAAASPRHALRAAHARQGIAPGLLGAARRQTLADRALVHSADALARCLAQAGAGANDRCSASAEAIQHAGRRLAGAEHALARLARSAPRRDRLASASARTHTQLSVSGTRLTWTRSPHTSAYLVERRVQGQAAHAAQYDLVTGSSWTPPPLPGHAVRFRVRAATAGAPWSNAQTIDYPASSSSGATGSGQPAGAGEASPAPSSPESPAGAVGAGGGGAKQTGTETAPVGVATPSHHEHPGGGEAGEGWGPQAAPTVSLEGDTLYWPAIADVDTYVLETRVNDEAPSFSEVSGTSVTPTAVPGASVHYNVRTAVDGSAWSTEVTIAYPPAGHEEPGESQPAGGFEPGINSGTEMNLDVNGAADLGAKVVRVAFEDGTTPAQMEPVIAAYAARGIRVAPLLSFYGSMPTPAQAQALAGWAKAFGPGGSFWATHGDGQLAIRTIEFGNETSGGYQYGDNAGEPSYQARAETYAVRLKEAAEAIASSGEKVGLLAVAEDWTGNWMDGMFSAVPNLGSYVAGWVSHPYGTQWRSKIEDIVAQSAAHGASSKIPIDVTEWGLSSDNGSCVNENFGFNACMSYQQAAETMRTVVGEMRHMLGGRL